MEWPVKCALPGRNGTLPKMQRRHQMRNDLLELYVIHQARLLHPLDAPQWTDIFEDTTKRLLATRPLQSLSKRGRLGVAMSIVGSRNVKLFAPTVLAVLACDWHNEWASFKLLEGVVRQASLSWVRSMSMSECGRGEDQEDQVPREWSRKVMASTLEEGIEDVVARSWRALHIGGVARERVEKTGRELRALAARCRGAVDRSKARQLMGSYLKSYRLGGFAQAFVSWGQDQLRETPKPSIFDDAFGFLEERMVEASRARAGQWRAAQVNHARVTNVTNVTNTPLDGGKVREDSTPLRELENDTGSPYALSRRGKRLQRSSAVSSSARAVGGGRVGSLQETWPATLGEDTPKSPVESGACSKQSALCGEGVVAAAEGRGDRQSGNGGEKGGVLGMSVDHLAEGENAGEDGKRRLLDMLRVGAKVLVKRDATIASASPSLSLGRAGVLTAVRGDGTYDILYDDGEVGDMLRRGDVVGGYEMGLLEDSLKLKLPRGDARSRSEDLSRDGAGGTMKVRRGKKRILVSLVDEDPVSPLSAPESWQDSPQGMTHGEDVRVDDAPLSSPAVGADAVDQRGTAGRILRKYRKRRILQEDGDDEISDHTDGAAPATVELLITADGAGRESPVRTPCTSVGVGERGPGPNEGGIKNSRTRLDNLLDAANDWADRTGNDGDASAKINLGAEGIDATHGRSTSPQMEDASPFGKVSEGNSQRDLDEREEGMKGASLASTTENTVTRGAGIDPLVAGGGIEKAGSTGIMDRQRGATRDGRGRIAGAELDSKNDPNNHSRREEMSAVGSAKETDGGLEMDTDEMDTEEMDIDEMDTDDGDGNGVLERAAVGQNMYKMCDRSNQGGNAVENVRGGTVAKRFASPSPSPPVARAEENVVLTRAQGKMVHREMPSVEGLAEGGKPRRKNTLSTERDKLESDDEDDPTEGGRVRPKQGQEETDLEVETDKNGPSRGGPEDEEKSGGRLPPSGREACQGYERGDTPRSYPPQPAGQGDHLAAAAANTPPPNSPTYRWARLPVRRTRRPLSLEAESGVGERANGPLLEGSPQGSQGGPRDHGDGDDEECIDLEQGHQEQGHDVREMRLWPRHEQPVGSEEETNVEGVVRKGDGEVTTGASDQSAVSTERVDGEGDEVGETEFATPTAMMRTPAATRRITTADLADSADSSSAAREENEKEVRIARDAEGGEGSAGGEEGEGRAHDARVDSQVPKPPPKFMRVYGSVGITRVRRSIQNMFGQR